MNGFLFEHYKDYQPIKAFHFCVYSMLSSEKKREAGLYARAMHGN